jgi:ABC-type multidrug transport system ATPase subunit
LRRRSSIESELAIRKRVAYLPDQPWLPNNRTGREFLLAVGRLYEIDAERLMNHVDRLLELFQLKAQGDSPIRSYSNGQKKKVAICSVLVSEASVLLLDEPFSGGLDPSGLMVLRQVLKRLTDETDVTVVMASPVAELVEGLADRVAVIREGQIAAYDTIDGLRRLTNCTGSLQELLERLIRPQTLEDIERYFGGRPL